MVMTEHVLITSFLGRVTFTHSYLCPGPFTGGFPPLGCCRGSTDLQTALRTCRFLLAPKHEHVPALSAGAGGSRGAIGFGHSTNPHQQVCGGQVCCEEANISSRTCRLLRKLS